ncbi:unnamed protein product [Sphagnum troendelagicum]|uniref:Uncharacterized protein n=1 Tax=Sphagnum troendelagicum TaxID=128251 RepID=A0ABP0T6Q5_9BRYO
MTGRGETVAVRTLAGRGGGGAKDSLRRFVAPCYYVLEYLTDSSKTTNNILMKCLPYFYLLENSSNRTLMLLQSTIENS